jgi:hypothetical protein
MTAAVYRFTFSEEAPLDEAEMTLQLSIFAVEGVFGAARVRLEFSYFLDELNRLILVDGTNEVGLTIARIFTSLLLRELGENAFKVRPVQAQACSPVQPERQAA